MAPITWTQPLLLSCLLLLLTTPWTTDGFEYSGYCRKMCEWGRGGNLCKCSAVHFAGKRQLGSPTFSAAAPGRDVVGDAEDAVEDAEETLEGGVSLEEARGRVVDRMMGLLGKMASSSRGQGGDKEGLSLHQLQNKDHLERLISILLRKTSDSP